MNYDAHNDATGRPISLNNESSPDDTVFPDTLLPPLPAPSPVLPPAPPPFFVPDAHWGGGGLNALGLEFGRRNTFLLPLRPGGRGQEDIGRKGSPGKEAVADTGPPRRRDISSKTRPAEALSELATVNKEEWGGGYMLGTCDAFARFGSAAVKRITVGT